MKDLEDVSSYITRVQAVANQLKHNGKTLIEARVGKTLIEARVVEKILGSLTNDFENIICTNEESKNVEEVTIYDLGISLEETGEQLRKRKKQDIMEKVLQTKIGRCMCNTNEDMEVIHN